MEIRYHIDPHVTHLSKLDAVGRAAYMRVLAINPGLHAAVIAHLRTWSPEILADSQVQG